MEADGSLRYVGFMVNLLEEQMETSILGLTFRELRRKGKLLFRFKVFCLKCGQQKASAQEAQAEREDPN